MTNLSEPIPPLDSADARWLRVKEMILEQCLFHASAEQPILSPNGVRQNWLLDLRRLMLEPEGIALVADLFWERMEPFFPFQVVGMETAAVPLITAVQMAGKKRGKAVNGVIVRKERKTSGLGRLIEGDFNDAPVIVVDDIVNSAQSLEKIRAVLIEMGISIMQIVSIVDFRSAAGLSWRTRHGIAVQSLFDATVLKLKMGSAVAATPHWRLTRCWKHESPGADPFSVVPKSTPVADGSTIYVADDSGAVVALRMDDGAVLWRFQAAGTGRKGSRSTPALQDGRLYFAAYNGVVYCLDASNGDIHWQFGEADWIGSSPVLSLRHGLLFIGVEYALPGRRGGVLALDLQQGKRVWEHAARNYVHCTPCLGADEAWIACGDNDGNLDCLDARTGALIWRYRAGGPIKSAPVHDALRGQIIAGSFDGAMHMVDAGRGELNWKLDTQGTLYTTPLIEGGRLIFGSSDKSIYVADLDKRTLMKRIAVDGKILAQPRRYGDRVCVGSSSGRLYILDEASLTVDTAVQLPDRIVNAVLPLPQRDMLIVPTCDNKLFAFKVEEALPSPSAEAALTVAPEAQAYRPLARDIADAYSDGLYLRMSDAIKGAAKNEFPFMPSRRLLGAAMLLASASARHRDMPLSQLEGLLVPALRNNHLRLFLYGVRPYGLVIWAYPPESAKEKLLTGARLSPEEWNAGETPWLIDVIAPFGGGNEMVHKVQRSVLSGKPLTVVKRGPDGAAMIDLLKQ